MNLKPLLSGLGICSVIGTGSLGVTYVATKETVSDGLKKSGISLVPQNQSSETTWSYLLHRLLAFFKYQNQPKLDTDIHPINFSKPPTKEFHDFFKSMFKDLLNREVIVSSIDSQEEKEATRKLKEFCRDSSASAYKTLFSQNNSLLENVGAVCSAKNFELISGFPTLLLPFIIKPLVEKEKDSKMEESESDLKKNLEKLEKAKADEKLDEKLSSIKERNKGEGNKEDLWRELGE